MRKTGVQLLFIGLVLIISYACDRNRIFDEYKEIPQSGWNKDSMIVFNIPISDTLKTHNLLINVRNNFHYKFSNLWLFIEINQPGGTTLTDTFELSLADPTGKWLGEGFGGIKTSRTMYKRSIYFPVSGEYQIKIQHGMRGEILNGISDIGFRVEKAE